MGTKKNKIPYIYPEYIVQVLNHLMNCSISDRYPQLSKGTEIINMLYNQFNDFPITDQVYNMMWSWINRMVEVGKEDWVKMYWSTASQYYTFKLQNSRNNKAKERFKEFHLMVCVLLLAKKKYEALRHALSFSSSLPAKYPLVPSSYREIFKNYCDLSDKNQFMYLLNYHIIGSNNGAGEENKIESFLLDYVALLIIRLNTVNDYNITYSDPMDLPDAGNTKEENENLIFVIETLKTRLYEFANEVLEKLGLKEKDIQDKAYDLLENYADACNHQINEIVDNPKVSEEKKERLKKELQTAIKTNKISLPCTGFIKDGKELTFSCQQQVKLDERLILSGYNYISSNLADSIIHALYIQIQKFYCYQFLLQSACCSYGIPYRDCEKALKKLSLDDNFIILAFGVNSYFFEETGGFIKDESGVISFNGCSVINIPSNDNSLVIMKKDSVPYCNVTEYQEKLTEGEVLIEEKHCLYSNINILSKDNPVLTVKQGYILHIPSLFKYVRLRISYHLASDDVIISKIVPISKSIV